MSYSNNNDQNDDIIVFRLSHDTITHGLITRMYRKYPNFVFVEAFNGKHIFFVEIQEKKLNDTPKLLRNKAEEELSVQGVSSEDAKLIGLDAGLEITNNFDKLDDLKGIDTNDKKKKGKHYFTLDDVIDANGRFNESKLNRAILRDLHRDPAVLHANKVTVSLPKKGEETNQVLIKLKDLKAMSLDERYRFYEQVESIHTVTENARLYEAIPFRSNFKLGEQDSDELTENIYNKQSDDTNTKDNKKKDNDDERSLTFEDLDRYETKFVYFDPDIEAFKAVDYVIKKGRFIMPNPTVGLATIPYQFVNLEHLNEFYKREVKGKITIDTLFEQFLKIYNYFNKQPATILITRACAAVASYYIDKFSVTPYFADLGIPNSGKSTSLNTLMLMVYRAYKMTNPSAAQLIRAFGNVEPVQLTFIIDEADKLDQDSDVIIVIKDGYEVNGIFQRVNDITRLNDTFYIYAMKFISAESIPKAWKAEGFLSRTFLHHTMAQYISPTDPNVKNLSGNTSVIYADQQWKKFVYKVRKQALIHRMVTFSDQLPELDIGVSGRDKELTYPIIQLFHKSKYKNEIIKSMQQLLNFQSEQRRDNLSTLLCTTVAQIMIALNTNKFKIQMVWDRLLNDEEFGKRGRDVSGKNQWINSYNYGQITPDIVMKDLRDNIKHSIDHTRKGNFWVIDCESLINRLDKFKKEFNKIVIKQITKREGCEPCEADIKVVQDILSGSKTLNQDNLAIMLHNIGILLADMNVPFLTKEEIEEITDIGNEDKKTLNEEISQ